MIRTWKDHPESKASGEPSKYYMEVLWETDEHHIQNPDRKFLLEKPATFNGLSAPKIHNQKDSQGKVYKGRNHILDNGNCEKRKTSHRSKIN